MHRQEHAWGGAQAQPRIMLVKNDDDDDDDGDDGDDDDDDDDDRCIRHPTCNLSVFLQTCSSCVAYRCLLVVVCNLFMRVCLCASVCWT